MISPQKIDRVLGKIPLPAVAILLSVPASWQLMAAGYFDAHDSLLHLLRLIEFDAALRSGDLFPRWLPDLALGYGYPLFNYYPPLTYYVAEAFHLAGLGFGDSLKAVAIAGLTLSGLGMSLFARDLFGSRSAALLSAVAYVYFPYHLTDVYIRGAIPEATSLVFMPFALWAFHRLAVRAARGYVIAGALSLTGIILTHVIFIFFLPILSAYVLAIALTRPRVQRKKALLYSLAAFGLGVSLAAFYWLPVQLERRYVSLVSADWVVGDTIRDELHSPEAMVQWSPTYDYHAEFSPKLAAADLAIAAGGLGLWLAGRKRRRLLPALAVFIAALPIFIFLLAEPSFPIWRQLPVVGLVQFPWRLLALVGLCTSLLAGLLAVSGRFAYLIAATACLFIIVANTRGLERDFAEKLESSPSLETLASYEYESGVMGTAYANEWLPSTAKPGFTSPIYKPFMPPEASGEEALAIEGFRRAGPLSYVARVTAEKPSRLRLHAFFFPGWQARIDGRAADTYPSTDLGLVTFDVPAGEHEVSLSFSETPARTLGRAISLATLAGLSLACLWTLRRREGRPRLAQYSLSALPLLLAGLLAVQPHLTLASPTTSEWEAVDFAGRLRLLGFEVETGADLQKGKLEVTLYWQNLQVGGEDLHMSVEAFDRQGNLIGAQEGRPIFSTSQTSVWSQNEIVRDKREMPLSYYPTSGPAFLRLGVWEDGSLLGFAELMKVNN